MEDVRISFWYLLALLHINVWVTRCNMTPELKHLPIKDTTDTHTQVIWVKCLSAIRRFESNIRGSSSVVLVDLSISKQLR